MRFTRIAICFLILIFRLLEAEQPSLLWKDLLDPKASPELKNSLKENALSKLKELSGE